MTARELVRTRAHLADNRRLILGHAVAAAVVGMTPLPYLDEYLPSLVRRQMVRRIAESRGVDLDDDALRAIADGTVKPGTWRGLIGATPLLGLLRRSLRTAMVALNVYRRAEAASRTFALATLFDHYCARIHVGGALDGEAGRTLRGRMEEVVLGAMGSLPAWAVRRAFARTLVVAAKAPAEVWRKIRQRRLPRGEVLAEEIIEEGAETMTAMDGGATRSFVDQLVDAFEKQPR